MARLSWQQQAAGMQAAGCHQSTPQRQLCGQYLDSLRALLGLADSVHSLAAAAGQRHQAQAPSMGPAEQWGGAHHNHRCLGSPGHLGRRGWQPQSLGHHHVRGSAVQGVLPCAGHAAACSMLCCAEHAAA